MKKMKICLILCIILIMCSACSKKKLKDDKQTDFKPHDVNVYVINVGKADSILVNIDDKNYLIDTGENTSVRNIKYVLDSLQISNLDAVFITHTHSDHLGGLKILSELVGIDMVYSAEISMLNKNGNNKVENITSEIALPHTYLKSEDNIDITDDIKFEILGPIEYNNDDDNDNSLIMKLNVNGRRFLFTGDMQFAEEKTLINKGFCLTSDVLKVGNHGNKDATSQEFATSVSPSAAIISTDTSVDENSASQKVIKRLDDAKTYITQDYDLAVWVNVSHESEITIKNMQKQDNQIEASASELKISNVSKEKQILTLENASSHDVDLSNYWIYSTKGGEIFCFENGTIIKSGNALTVASLGAEGDFIWQDKKVWNKNKEDIAILYDAFGNEITKCQSE